MNRIKSIHALKNSIKVYVWMKRSPKFKSWLENMAKAATRPDVFFLKFFRGPWLTKDVLLTCCHCLSKFREILPYQLWTFVYSMREPKRCQYAPLFGRKSWKRPPGWNEMSNLKNWKNLGRYKTIQWQKWKQKVCISLSEHINVFLCPFKTFN